MEAGEFEPYYEIVFGIARGAGQLITGAALAMLCRHFFADRKAARRVWWVGAAYLVVVLLFLYVPFNMYAFAVYLLCFSSAYLTLCCLEKENSRVWFFFMFYLFYDTMAVGLRVAESVLLYRDAPGRLDDDEFGNISGTYAADTVFQLYLFPNFRVRIIHPDPVRCLQGNCEAVLF